MKVEILISDITKVATKTRMEDGLVTTIQFDARVPVASLARILNLQRQGAPLLVRFSSPQAAMDLVIQEDRDTQADLFTPAAANAGRPGPGAGAKSGGQKAT